MRRFVIMTLALFAASILLSGVLSAGKITTLQPRSVREDAHKRMAQGTADKDVKWVQGRQTRKEKGRREMIAANGVCDQIITNRTMDSYDVNFGYSNPGDSGFVWFQAPADLKVLAVRIRSANWVGNMLVDIWETPYTGNVQDNDSGLLDAGGWLSGGTHPLGFSSPLGAHVTGPVPRALSATDIDVWTQIDIPAQPVFSQGDNFGVGMFFMITGGWGFSGESEKCLPADLFKWYQPPATGPDGTNSGWFIRHFHHQIELLVTLLGDTPPDIEDVTDLGITLSTAPREVSATVTDINCGLGLAGVAAVQLCYSFNGGPFACVGMTPSGDVYTADIPGGSLGDDVEYFVSAEDLEGKVSESEVYGYSIFPKICEDDPYLGGFYAGGTYPGLVYKYIGGSTWIPISDVLGYSVRTVVEYDGDLYAGTQTEDYCSGDPTGQVWRYDGDCDWTLVGDDMDDVVNVLVVYDGDLYAGTSWNGARLYRYNSPGNWTLAVDYGDWSGIRSAYAWDYDGLLYVGDNNFDLIGQFDGTVFLEVTDLEGSCIWDFEEYDGELYTSAYTGRIHKTSDGFAWTTVIDYDPEGRDVWNMQVYDGDLYYGKDWYGGTAETQLFSYDGATSALVWAAPVDEPHEGILSMASDGLTLLFGLGVERSFYCSGSDPCADPSGPGLVYSYDGSTVSPVSVDMGVGVQTLYYTPAICPVDVLIYYGNGGPAPDEMSYYTLQAYYNGLGFPTDYTDIWPLDLNPYRLITLVGPGDADDSGTHFFTAGQVAQLRNYLLAGGRLFVMGEHSGVWGDNTVNDLLSNLGVGILQNADAATPDGDTVTPLSDITPDQMTTGVASIDLAASSSLSLSGSALSLVRVQPGIPGTITGATVIAVDQIPGAPPRPGGDVVVSGDENFLDDWMFTDPAGDGVLDNYAFAQNLVTFMTCCEDIDGDGVCPPDDCDDTDPNNFAGNIEVCDGQDNDCDGLVDNSDPGMVNSPDFAVEAYPPASRVQWFMSLLGTAAYDVTVRSIDCYAGAVSLSVAGLPPGTRGYYFVPGAVALVPPRSSVKVKLVIEVTRSTIPGDYSVAISGGDGMTIHTDVVTLEVRRPSRWRGPFLPKAGAVPEAYVLEQNYPNPFNPETSIEFGLPEEGQVKVTVYNTLGQVVEELIDTELDAGYYTVSWDATGLPTGVYFYRIVAGSFTETKRMVYMK